MSLVANYDSSDNSDKEETSDSSSDESPDDTNSQKLAIPDVLFKKSRLDKQQLNVTQRKLSQNSVYSNPFAQTEASVCETLSKHKQLTSAEEQTPKMKKKERLKKEKQKMKLCVHFFKTGNCKYGNDCKFSHKLLNQSETVAVAENADSKGPQYSHTANLSKKKNKRKSTEYQFHGSDNENGDGTEQVPKKKRPGLGDNIIPGKKVLKNYDKIYTT